MTREEAIKELIAFKDKSWDGMPEEVIDMAIKALEQESCGDAISRESFTDSTICEGFSCNECSFNRKNKGGCILEERVKALPSIQPKTGHWILVNRNGANKYVCSECDNEPLLIGESYPIVKLSDYCPYCGAKMEGN